MTEKPIGTAFFDFLSVPTGIPKLDAVLRGGLDWGGIHALEGKNGRGKTQMEKKIIFELTNAGVGPILFIDADAANGLTTKSLLQGIQHNKWDMPKIPAPMQDAKKFKGFLLLYLKKKGIHIRTPMGHPTGNETIEEARMREFKAVVKRELVMDPITPYRAIFIDSLTLIYKDLMTIKLGGNAMKRMKQHLPEIISIMSLLDGYAKKHNTIIIIVTQMRSDYGKSVSPRPGVIARDDKDDEEHENIGGDLINHHLCTKLRFIKKGDTRHIILMKNRSGPTDGIKVPFKITDGGVEGV